MTAYCAICDLWHGDAEQHKHVAAQPASEPAQGERADIADPIERALMLAVDLAPMVGGTLPACERGLAAHRAALARAQQPSGAWHEASKEAQTFYSVAALIRAGDSVERALAKYGMRLAAAPSAKETKP